MKTKIITFVAFLGIITAGCSKKGHEHTESSSIPVIEANTLSKEQAASLYQAYLLLKDALVATDGAKAQEEAKKLLTVLQEIGEKQELKSFKEDALHIAETSDVEHQRDHFYTLSKVMYAIVKSIKPTEEEIYKQYCPMAFNDKGAFWLSNEKDIKNPYFGNKMLTCGVIEEKL
ncbi:MAG: DUF3347 domain-containing protein [Flammeovirgaceae bacterium]|nr:DUF3347 domain-containing protein [Flammeovirgaceae bacterium]MDW8287275.1 DUF3347 domain-containing protein [Flammeovirgaceae bacterium]